MNEEWRDIPGYEGRYQASSLGRIRNKRTGRCLTPQQNTNGYPYVAFGHARKNPFGVHRLLALTFVPGYAPGLEVNHRNGIKTDNRLKNLEWVTRSENVKHSFRNLVRVPQRMCKTLIRKEGQQHEFRSLLDATKFLNASVGAMHSAIKKGHKCRGWEVRYV